MKKLFTLLTLLVCVCTGAWADDITVTWLSDGSSTSVTSTAGAASVANILTVSNLTISSDIASGPSAKDYSTGGTHWYGYFTCTTGTGTDGNYSKDDYITFAVTVNNGYTFIPTSVTLKAIGIGTGAQGAIVSSTILTSNAKNQLGKGDSSNQNPTDLSLNNFSKSTYEAGETLYFYVHIGSKAANKSVGLRDVVLSGTYTSSAPAVTYNVTYKANNGTEEEDIVDTEASKVADNTFTVPSGNYFSGWNTEANGSGTPYAVGATVTSDLTLYAQFKNSTLYSMTTPTDPTGNVASGTGSNVTATLSGGTAYVHNGKNAAAAMITNNQINLGGSGASYFLATITTEGTKIAVGDIIKISNSNANFYISGTSTKPGEASDFTNGEYIVPEGSNLVNSETVYIWKGSTSTFSSFTITRIDPSHVATPVISFSENKATITCKTNDVTIRYTIDGTEPTNSSAEYSEAVNLTNSCTVRAKAFKGTYQSSEASKDCYVDHSSAANFLTILKFNGGTVGTGDDAKVWTSSDGKYVLTDLNNAQTDKWSGLEESQDAFKLSHVDGYTLAVPSNVKITKVAFIGKSLYRNLAGSIAVTTEGFTPANASFIKNADEEGFVKYLSTIEFTNSSLNFGDAIAFNPGGCESAAYIEIYGEELPTSVSANISAYGYATFSSTYALDFTAVDNAKAYIVTEKSGNSIKLQEVTGKVAANTGLILKSNNGGAANVTIPVTTDEGTYYDLNSNPINYLFALDGSYLTLGAANPGTNYVLTVQYDKVVFAPIGSTTATVKAGQAALWLPASAGAKALTLSFADDVTGINEVGTIEPKAGKIYYNLQGQRVSEPKEGIYVVEGKKVLVNKMSH